WCRESSKKGMYGSYIHRTNTKIKVDFQPSRIQDRAFVEIFVKSGVTTRIILLKPNLPRMFLYVNYTFLAVKNANEKTTLSQTIYQGDK
ncbi:hypothetical protein, partial [Geobacillus sp. WSUCF-018B]|uniref:hypothetical protein n=1 Tax=Geobacillus sp. WSUCF-018B TaxID=2055939 RepID=UPI001E5524D7